VTVAHDWKHVSTVVVQNARQPGQMNFFLYTRGLRPNPFTDALTPWGLRLQIDPRIDGMSRIHRLSARDCGHIYIYFRFRSAHLHEWPFLLTT